MLVRAVLTIISILIPTAAAQAGIITELAGSTYHGTATVEGALPDGVAPHRASGEAEITLTLDDQGLLLFAGEATIDGRRAMRFDYTLSAQLDGSLLADDEGALMKISPQGEISMLAVNDTCSITAAGSIDATGLQMHLRTNGHEVEPDFIFVFDLARAGKARPDRTDNCANVVWQPRSVANPFGGSMSSTMVPVCIPAPRN